MEYFVKTGVSVENRPYRVLLEFPDKAPDGADPERLIVLYDADDGMGMVGIERTADGLYKRRDDPATHANPAQLMPWVVFDGIQDEGMKQSDSALFLSCWMSCEKST